MTDAPAPLPLALFWAQFHARRNLQKRAFRGWAVACVLGYLSMRLGGRIPAAQAAEQILFFVLPLLSLFFGGGVLREEIEDQTITYSFTRPLDRGWIYAARVVAAMVPVLILSMPFLVIESTLLDGATGARVIVAGLAATLAYTGVFALLGLLMKWSTWVGLAWLIFWESLVSLAPGFIGHLTLQSHLRGLTGFRPRPGLLSSLWQPPSAPVGLIVLLGVAAASLVLGGVVVRRREIALEK
jgi:ABC-2 type transport system permease protein